MQLAQDRVTISRLHQYINIREERSDHVHALERDEQQHRGSGGHRGNLVDRRYTAIVCVDR
jgi:hypothetical protein